MQLARLLYAHFWGLEEDGRWVCLLKHTISLILSRVLHLCHSYSPFDESSENKAPESGREGSEHLFCTMQLLLMLLLVENHLCHSLLLCIVWSAGRDSFVKLGKVTRKPIPLNYAVIRMTYFSGKKMHIYIHKFSWRWSENALDGRRNIPFSLPSTTGKPFLSLFST